MPAEVGTDWHTRAQLAISSIPPMPALPEKMASEWLPRPAAYRPAGIHKKDKNFLEKFLKNVTLFKLFSILDMNKKIGKKNEDRTLSLRNQTRFGGAKIGVYTLCLRLLLLLCLKGWSSLYRWRKRRHVLY